MEPFYKRELDSFADDIIARVAVKTKGDVYYAVMDVPKDGMGSFPDYSVGASTPEEAVRRCAAAIRADHEARKQDPRPSRYGVTPGSYDLDFRLKKHWARKELRADNTRHYIKGCIGQYYLKRMNEAGEVVYRRVSPSWPTVVSTHILLRASSRSKEGTRGWMVHQKCIRRMERWNYPNPDTWHLNTAFFERLGEVRRQCQDRFDEAAQ